MLAHTRGPRWGTAASIAWLILVLACDLLAGTPSFALTVLFGVAPLIACAVLPPAPTAAVAAVAAGLAVVSGVWNGTLGTAQHVIRGLGVVVVGTAAVVVAAIRDRREAEVARMTAIADVAQQAILPVIPDRAGAVKVAARYLSAAQDAMVGGDLYDCYRYNDPATGRADRVRFIVGDVRGKGISGVVQAARVIRAFRQSAALEPTLPLLAQAMDRYLADFFEPEEFVTAILIDASDASRLLVTNCGHPPALLHRRGGESVLVDAPTGLPLGMSLSDAQPYSEVVVSWGPGDRLLLYTDGLSEARDRRGEFLSPLELEPAMEQPDVYAAMEVILAVLARHIRQARLSDDLALLLLECADPDPLVETAAGSPERASMKPEGLRPAPSSAEPQPAVEGRGYP